MQISENVSLKPYNTFGIDAKAKYFASFFKKKVFVGQMRTRLGIQGHESSGPKEAALELLRIIGVTM